VTYYSRIFTTKLWIHEILPVSNAFIFPTTYDHMRTKLLCTLQSTIGIAVSALCAILVALVFSKTHWKMVAPFLFAGVLVMLASRFGAMVSVVGSLLGTMIFALLLFSPIHKLQVENETERATLAWMILLSVSASYLLFPTPGSPSGE
jgi:K+-sensing histidine kinase KdpD